MAVLYRKIERGWFNWHKVYDDWAQRVPENGHIVEVGAHQGKSTLYLLEKLFENGKFRKTRFDVNDIFGMEWGEIWFIVQNLNNAILPNGIRAIAGVNIMQVNSRESHRLYEDNSLDFVTIDGDHSYEGCMADLVNFWPKLKVGGELAIHDMNHPHIPEVARAVNDFMATVAMKGEAEMWLNVDDVEFGHKCDTAVIRKMYAGEKTNANHSPKGEVGTRPAKPKETE